MLPPLFRGSADLRPSCSSSNSGEFSSKRRSVRLATKKKGSLRTALFRAQDLMCRKHKLVRIAVKAVRSSSSSICASPQVRPNMRAPSPRAPILGPALISVPVHYEGEGAEVFSARRDTRVPLSPDEIRHIQEACGIVVGGVGTGGQPGAPAVVEGGP